MTKRIFSIALFNDASELSWKQYNDCSTKFCPKQFTNELRFKSMLPFILNDIMSTSWSQRSGLMKMNFSGWTKTSSNLGKHEYCNLKTIWKSKKLNVIGLKMINFGILFYINICAHISKTRKWFTKSSMSCCQQRLVQQNSTLSLNSLKVLMQSKSAMRRRLTPSAN